MPRRSALGKPVVWVSGAVMGGAGAVIGGAIYALPEQAVDVPAVQDSVREIIRGDGDVGYSVDDYTLGSSYALPTGAPIPADLQQVLQIGTRRILRGPEKQRLLDGWSRAGAARVADELVLRVTLRSRRNQAVTLTGIQAVNIDRTAPHSGPLYWEPPQGGGPLARMILDLTEQRPQARVARAVGSGDSYVPGRLFFLENALTLKQSTPEALVIRAQIRKTGSPVLQQTVTFDIRVDYRIGGQARYVLLRPGGRPFRVTPLNCRPGQRYAAHSQTWQPTFQADARTAFVAAPASCEP